MKYALDFLFFCPKSKKKEESKASCRNEKWKATSWNIEHTCDDWSYNLSDALNRGIVSHYLSDFFARILCDKRTDRGLK